MLEGIYNIQAYLQFDAETRNAWVIIPDRQQESRFLDHKKFVHLSTICDIFIRNSLRKNWSCRSKTLFYLYEDFERRYNYEIVRMTEWAREALLNRTCTNECHNCPELSKADKNTKIECRMNHGY